MAVDTYTVVSWQPNELITEAKMDTIGNNLQWLYDRMPRATYSAWSVNQTKGIKIVAGMTIIPPDANGVVYKDVHFGNIFTPGCRPVVTTGLISATNRRVHVTIDGLGVIYPDDRGFSVIVVDNQTTPKNNKFTKSMYVSWIAIGY